STACEAPLASLSSAEGIRRARLDVSEGTDWPMGACRSTGSRVGWRGFDLEAWTRPPNGAVVSVGDRHRPFENAPDPGAASCCELSMLRKSLPDPREPK